jgi:citrate lyase subunit beta/citryl-CoA lyase
MSRRLQQARSFLFVPATRLERMSKAFDASADAVIMDLEDAVAPDSKDAARAALAERLPQLRAEQRARLLVRINAVGTPWHEADLELLAPLMARGQGALMLPKAEDPLALRRVAAHLRPAGRVLPLIESLAGLDQADALAREAQVLRLAFGHLDFQLDLGMRCAPEEAELNGVRFSLVAASRRAHLPAPIDGVTTDTGNAERLATDTARARAFGFGAKLCIHPAQVAAVNQGFSPSDVERDWAQRVLELAKQHGGQAFSLDGRMVDLPVIRAAEAMISLTPPDGELEFAQ